MDLMIESLEGGTYLVYTIEEGRKRLVTSESNSAMSFRSLAQIKDHYQGEALNRVALCHRSAYDEMCGLPSSEAVAMMVDLNWR